MENDIKYVPEISIKKLKICILLKWKFIFICSLFFSVLLGCYAALPLINIGNDQYKQKLINDENDLGMHTNEIEGLKSQIASIQTMKERLNVYNLNSIKMNIDPLLYVEGVIVYYIGSEDSQTEVDINSSILTSFSTYINNGAMYQQILDNISYDSEAEYLREIITGSADYVGNMLTVTVSHKTKEQCQELIHVINNLLHEKSQEIILNIGSHQLKEIEETVITRKNYDLLEYQNASLIEIDRLKNDQQELESKLADLQTVLAPVLLYNQGDVIKKTIMFIIIGGIFGFFLSVTIVISGLIFTDRLYSLSDLKQRINLEIVSIVPSNKKNKLGSLLLKDNGIRENLTFDEGIEITYESVKNYLLYKTVGNLLESHVSILLIGSNNNIRFSEICNKLEELTKKEHIRFIKGMNILDDVDSIRKLRTFDYILLVEQFNISKVEMIESQVNTLKKLGKHILGTIII